MNKGPFIEIFFPMFFGSVEVLVDLLNGLAAVSSLGA
jgi:hypothetical protein